MKATIVALAIASQVLGGCAELTHLTRTRDLGESTAILIDAKQRGIFTRQNVMCAEPSPDALSAIAVSQSANITSKGTSAAESFGLAEAAGSIGLRTQSIQLMRDHMYRLCEAYQNKAITPLTFELLHRRFQTEMVAILAIEQLTGTVRAPAVVLGGSSASGNADAIVKLTSSRETAASAVATAESDLKTKKKTEADAQADVAAKQATFDAATDTAAKASAKTALDQAKEKADSATSDRIAQDDLLAGRNAVVAAIDRALTLAQASGSASATGAIENVFSRGPADIASVATAVQSIVTAAMAQTNVSDFCTLLLSESARIGTTLNEKSSVIEVCLDKLKMGEIKAAGP